MASSNNQGSSKVQDNPFITKKIPKDDDNDRKNVRFYFAQYCGATSIHGVQYLGERSRNIIERIFWILIIVTVLSLCVTLIAKTYNKWVTSPVIVTFATTETSISNVPFPAITICPEVKANPEIFNYTDTVLQKLKSNNISDFEEEFLESIALVCGNELSLANNKFADDITVHRLLVSAPIRDPVGVSTVSWLGNKMETDFYLDYSFTSEGVCYTFNMLDINEIMNDPEDYAKEVVSTKDRKIKSWSLDDGYPNLPINESYPRRTVLSGIDGGFVYDNMFVNGSYLDYICKDSLQGFKVVLHHPADFPNLDKHIKVPLDSAVYIGIKPRLTTVSETLRSYKAKDRKCYLVNEKQLQYFKTYTQNNCMEECYANYTLRKCNCLAFYMPKFSDEPICGAGSKNCVEESKVNYMREDKEKCACLPSCTALEYDMELTQTDWNWQNSLNVLRVLGFKPHLKIFEGVHLSKLAVYFKDMQFLSSERNELYGIVDFFSNVGGLCGLFIGISVTSFVEILYFCTLRFWCNFKRYGRRYWSGEPELLEAKEE